MTEETKANASSPDGAPASGPGGVALLPMDTDRLVEFVALIEMDPINRKDTVLPALRTLKNSGVVCTVDTVRGLASERCQVNPMADVYFHHNCLVFLCAGIQFGKTISVLFLIWKTGVLHRMPSLYLSMVRSEEIIRIEDAVKGFNDLVTFCADVMGMDPSASPQLKMYNGTKDHDSEFGEALQRGVGGAAPVPFYALMGNSSGVAKGIDLVANHVSMNVGRDAEDTLDSFGVPINDGRMAVALFADEADKLIQPGTMIATAEGRVHKRGALDAALGRGVILKKRVPHQGDPRRRRTPQYDEVAKDSFFDAFTSVALITSTPYAFSTTRNPLVSRENVRCVVGVPSTNYWALVKMPGWGCKLVENRAVGSYVDMLDFMAASPSTRHGLVTITAGNHSTMTKESQERMAGSASVRYPGMLSIAWSGDGTKVFTGCPTWSALLKTAKHIFEYLEDGGVARFVSKISYPSLVDFIYSKVAPGSDVPNVPTTVPTTVVFGLNMASRGTPIKGTRHLGSLTDQYVEAGQGANDETLEQGALRILGINKRTQGEGTYLWGTRSTLDRVYKAAIDSPYFVDKLEAQSSTPALVGETTDRIMRSDGEVEDTHQVTTVPIMGKTRALNERHVAHEMAGLKRARAANHTRIVTVPRPNVFEPYTINDYHVEGPDAEETVAEEDPSMEVENPSELPEMQATWDEGKDGICAAMAAVVGTSERPVTVRVMTDSIVPEDDFPSGTGFSVATFVRRFCTKEAALEGAGLVFRDGVFERRGL